MQDDFRKSVFNSLQASELHGAMKKNGIRKLEKMQTGKYPKILIM